MAQLINRRAQAAAEQEAMSRRGRGGSSRQLFSTDQADEFGRTSIFSKSPEKDPNFDPSKNVGNPYKENTKAGKRLNLRELQNRIAEAEGMRMLQKAGITLAIITGRNAPCVDVRMKNLGIDLVFQGIGDKLGTLQTLLAKLGIQADEAGFMGDDLIDLRAMAACGFSATPADSQDRVKSYARLISIYFN